MRDYVMILRDFDKNNNRHHLYAVPFSSYFDGGRIKRQLKQQYDRLTTESDPAKRSKAFVLGALGFPLHIGDIAEMRPKDDGSGLEIAFAPPEIITVKQWFQRYRNYRVQWGDNG